MNEKTKLADRKVREKKVKALRELAEKLESDAYDKETADIIKRTFKMKNKLEREEGTIAKNMPDVAEVIKETGDPILTKSQNLRTKFKTKDDAKAAGVQFKAGGGLAEATAKLKAKGMKEGGMVVKDKVVAIDKSPNSGLITTKGFGASRRT